MRRRTPDFVDEMCARATTEAAGQISPAEKAAVIAHYSTSPRVSRSMAELVGQFAANGYRPVVVSTCPALEPLDWGGRLPADAIVLRRRNEGYDFGSWAVGLRTFPEILRLRHVVLTNDSMVGPFEPIGTLLESFENSPTDVWAVTDSHQIAHHIQSYFVGFNNAVLDERPWRRFYGSVRHHDEKMDVVMRYEMGIMRVCTTEGYPWTVRYRADDLGAGNGNPTLVGWRRLLALGFPFVKRTIVSDPTTAPAGDQVAAVLRSRYGVELSEWL
ncbi:MAG: hypothetical protein GX427_03715 [Actinomycetales bacterium]|nr:hypothetical protein [Actinomycetales bacterium]